MALAFPYSCTTQHPIGVHASREIRKLTRHAIVSAYSHMSPMPRASRSPYSSKPPEACPRCGNHVLTRLVTLSLLVNEGITNSLKHGFEGRGTGIISIKGDQRRRACCKNEWRRH